MDSGTPPLHTESDIGSEIAVRVDTSAGPTKPAAVVIVMDLNGRHSAKYYNSSMAEIQPNDVVFLGATPTVVLLGVFGLYTVDVISKEEKQAGEWGGKGYWFPESRIELVTSNLGKAYTKTTINRMKKWIEWLNAGKADISGMVRNFKPGRPQAVPAINQSMAGILDNPAIIGQPDHIYVGSYQP